MPRDISHLKRGGPGRPAGVPNKATREIKEMARCLVEDEKYQASLVERLRRGTAPHMETLLYHYAYGKPKDTLEVALQVPLFALPEGTRVDMMGAVVAAQITAGGSDAVVREALTVGDAGTDAGDGGSADEG